MIALKRSRVLSLFRTLALAALYGTLLWLSVQAAYQLRFDFDIPDTFREHAEKVAAILIATQLALLFALRQFGSVLRFFSIPDLLRIIAAMAIGLLVQYISQRWFGAEWAAPRGVLLIDFIVSVSLLSGLRMAVRVARDRLVSSGEGRLVRRRIAIYGAGDAGASLAREILGKPQLGLKPVFFLDDDPRKHGHFVHGIQVVGSAERIEEFCAAKRIDSCVIAMPSAPGRRVTEIVHRMIEVGLKVEIVPSMAELATGRLRVSKIRPVDVEDLLGRAEAKMDSAKVAETVRARTVMVTGAGGSIGSELCRQLLALSPARLLLVERCEVQLFAIEQELCRLKTGATLVPLVADIHDRERMRHVFQRFSPNLVFHAAAHKHVPLMEHQPYEALKNNALGTKVVAELASEFGTDRFVLISTDKAINPTNAMGASKRMAELFLQAFQNETRTKTKFVAVRFGNVLGSSGSVIPTFKRQVAEGGPVTVTHPDVTRYFMTIPEAVGLVLQAGTIAEGGEIFVLDMGKPVKIVDLARQLIELSGLRPDVDIAIEYSGLRPGEKLFEEINHHSENLRATSHPKIMRFTGPADSLTRVCTELERLFQIGSDLPANQFKSEMKKLVPEYQPWTADL